MYCKVCGENLKPDAKFCENCGTKVVKEAEAGSKGDIKNCAEPINKKVEIEERKLQKENYCRSSCCFSNCWNDIFSYE